MSTAEKVARVAAVQDEFGLNRSLAVIGLPKSTWYYRCQQQLAYAEKYAHLRSALETIARRWPEYGYRRTTTALREEMGLVVNEKVVRRLHQSWDLALLRRTRRPKPSRLRQIIRQAGERANLIAALETINLFQVFYTDFTELPYADGQAKAHFMPILDHTSRLCLGWGLGKSANRDVALQAWNRAKAWLNAWHQDFTDSILHQDQDSVYTSYAWTGQLLLKERMRLSFALAGAKDNPHIESFFSRFKDEGHSEFLDAETLTELQAVVARRIAFYNYTRYHSSLGNRAPLVFIRQEYPEQVVLHI
jgi:putative transposase